MLREPIQVAFNLLPLHMVLKQAAMLELGRISGFSHPEWLCYWFDSSVYCVYRHKKNCLVVNPSGDPSIFLDLLAANIGRYNRQWLENWKKQLMKYEPSGRTLIRMRTRSHCNKKRFVCGWRKRGEVQFFFLQICRVGSVWFILGMIQ